MKPCPRSLALLPGEALLVGITVLTFDFPVEAAERKSASLRAVSRTVEGRAHEASVGDRAFRIPVPSIERAEVRGGDRVIVAWAPTGFEIEELELLLSVDGGKRYDLRVCPELETGRSRYIWRVPNLSTGCARIRIRARIGGCEVNGPESESFRIIADTERPPERGIFHEGGWWGDLESGGFTFPSLFESPSPTSLQERGTAPDLGSPVRVAASRPLPTACRLRASGASREAPAPVAVDRSGSRLHPMRE